MSLPPLKVKIGADTVDLEKSIADVERKLGGLQGATDRIAGGLKSFGDGATQLGKKMLPASAIVSGAGAAMLGLASATVSAGNEVDKAARAAGLGAEDFQELRFAVGQVTDLTDGEFANAMMQMNRRIGNAMDGNEDLIESFEALGFSQQEIADGTVDTEAALLALAEQLQGVSSDAEAARMAGELFGERLGGRLGPALRESGGDIDALREQARQLGIVLSEDTVKASAEAADQMSRIKGQFSGASHQIGAAMLPALSKFGDLLEGTIIPGIVSLAEGVAGVIDWFGQLPDGVQSAAGLVAAALGAGGPVLLAVGVMSKAFGALIAATGPVGLFIAAAGLLYMAWQKWGDDIIEVVGEAVDWIREKFESIVLFFEELPQRFLEFGRNMVQGLLNGFNEMWEAFKENIREKVDWIPDWIKRRLGIASPSKVFHEIGMNIGQGLTNGINDSFGMVRAAVQGLGDQVTNGAFDMASGVVDAMGQMFQGSKPIAAAQALINTFQGITEALKLPFPASLAAAARVAAQGFAAVRGIQSARPGSSGGISRTSGGSGGSGGTTSAQQQAPTTTFQFTLQNDPMGFGEQFARQFIEQLNEASANGGQIRGVIA